MMRKININENNYNNIIISFLHEDKNDKSIEIGKSIPKTKTENILPPKMLRYLSKLKREG